jgi:rhamnose transport system permease protein
MADQKKLFQNIWSKLKGWEGFLFLILIIVLLFNSSIATNYLTISNQVNLFVLSIERILCAITMCFIIMSGEIDLSVPSVMGLSAVVMAFSYSHGLPLWLGILLGLLTGLICGLFSGFLISFVGINSLIVTLALLIGFRGIARGFMGNNYIGNFPAWYNNLGQKPIWGPVPFAVILFFVFFIIGIIILQSSGFGRRIYVIGSNPNVARFSGLNTRQIKLILYVASGLMASVAGMLAGARFGSVRGDLATGWELDIITMVLLGGVSFLGGSGSLIGVFISILLILNIRNGLGLLSFSEHFAKGVIALLLIISVVGPFIIGKAADWNKRRKWKIGD